MKYIDAEKLKAEIERRMKKWDNLDKDLLSKNSEFGREAPINRWCELKDLLSFIESLEQEQEFLQIHGWVARDSKGYLSLLRENPNEKIKHQLALFDNSFFPDLRCGDEPIEVELKIHRL